MERCDTGMMWLISVQKPNGRWLPRFYSFYREIAENIAQALIEQDSITKSELVSYNPSVFCGSH